MAQPKGYKLDRATPYHYGRFPPTTLDYKRLHRPLATATEALARYDALLRNLHNKEAPLLNPLRSKEAVISSRIEGTIATLEEVLKIQADADEGDPDRPQDGRTEALEVFSYTRAMRYAQRAMEDGLPICGRLVREMHQYLMMFERGSAKAPGEFKTDQNYVVDQTNREVLFVPIESGESLVNGMSVFEAFINDQDCEFLIQTALAHLEFEALHPFKDGNGRVGRMLITLNLWDKKKISGPHFYISDYLEANRDEYIRRLRRVSEHDEWTEWVEFFLDAITAQSAHNTDVAKKIMNLYEEMKDVFRKTLASQWSTPTLDYVFEKAVFRNSAFTRSAGIPPQTAHRLSRMLLDAGLLTVIEPASGRRSGLYAFMPLLSVVRA